MYFFSICFVLFLKNLNSGVGVVAPPWELPFETSASYIRIPLQYTGYTASDQASVNTVWEAESDD